MSQPDRRSLLIGACRQRQEQILSKLAQVRQRLQVSNGLDNQRWVKVERDLLTRHEQEEQRIQRLMSESQESTAPSFEVRLEVEDEAPAESPEPEQKRGQFEALQQQFQRAQTLLAQKTQLSLRLQGEVASLQARLDAPSAELQELRSQNAILSAQLGGQASELAVMTESVVRLQAKNAALQAELVEKESSSLEVVRLQSELEQKAKEVEVVDELRHQIESLSADLLLKSLATERLQADIDLKGGQASRSQEELLLKVQGLEAKLQQSAGLQSRLEETEAELMKVTQDYSAVSELAGQRALQIEQLQREIDQLFQEVSNTHQSVQQHYEESQGFKSQLLAEQEQNRLAIADLRQQLSRAATSSAAEVSSTVEAPALESAPSSEVAGQDPAPEATPPSEAPEPEIAPQVDAREPAAPPQSEVPPVEAPAPEVAPTEETEELDLEGIPELVLDGPADFDFASAELDPPPDWLADEVEKPEFDFNSIEEENPPDWLVAEKPTE